MASALVTILLVAIVLSGAMMLAQSSFVSMDLLADSWKQMEDRTGDIARTELEVVDIDEAPSIVDITIRNSGQTSLRDFPAWDAAVQYYQATGTYHQRYLPYTTTLPPGNNQWTVVGIYTDAGLGSPEVYQPDILDPGEEMIVRIKLSPAAQQSAQGWAIIGTPNGVSVSTTF